MTYGVVIFNDNGSLKIDDSLTRYRSVVSGVATTNVNTPYTNQAYMPLIFLRPQAYGVPFRVGTIAANGFWVYRPTANTYDSTFEYHVCSRFFGGAIPTSGMGLCVTNAQNVLLFSSFDKCVNIDYISTFAIPDIGGVLNFTLPAPVFGRRFIAMVGPAMAKMVASGTYLTPYDMLIRLDSETAITVYSQVSAPINVYIPSQTFSVAGQPSLLISGYI